VRIKGLVGSNRTASSTSPIKTAEVFDGDDDWEFESKSW